MILINNIYTSLFIKFFKKINNRQWFFIYHVFDLQFNIVYVQLVDEHGDGSRPSTSSTITSRTRDDQHTTTTPRAGSEKVVNTIKVSSSTTSTTTPTPVSKSSRVKLNSSSSGNRYRVSYLRTIYLILFHCLRKVCIILKRAKGRILNGK